MKKTTPRKKHYRPSGKKKEGNAARYVTRSQAVKQLQVSLPVFRKLCIFKGVFPREPRKKVKGNHHTYYHLKDVAFIQHEPLVEKLRDIRAYDKKVHKAEAKKNPERASFLKARRPTYALDRMIRERYPKFVDALRDLDDCLSMVHLFAAFPAKEKLKIEAKRIHTCRRLSHEWQAYISQTHKLRKVFVSVKGIYFQAEVEGQKITWITPHSLHQVLPDDIDFTVILNFIEFYETLLSFVNFHLYHSINMNYPPILDPRLEAFAADLYALSRYFDANSRLSIVDPKLSGLSGSDQLENQERSDLRLAQLQHQLSCNEPGALMHLVEDAAVKDDEDDEETKECKKLFKNMKFFLSREVPRESLLFVIPSFGGVVSWEGEGAPFQEADESITHQIIDRPSQVHKFLSRDYVQPQWIFDCVNARIILPIEGYLVGRIPPPHLSPFVDNEEEGYVPDYAETIKRLQAATKNEVLPFPGVGKEHLDDPHSLLVEGVIDRVQAKEAAEKKKKMMALERQYHDELKMELEGVQYSSSLSEKQASGVEPEAREESLDDPQQVAKDHDKLSMVVMSRKKRKIYEAMQIGKQRKSSRTNTLKERKKKLSETQKSEAS